MHAAFLTVEKVRCKNAGAPHGNRRAVTVRAARLRVDQYRRTLFSLAVGERKKTHAKHEGNGRKGSRGKKTKQNRDTGKRRESCGLFPYVVDVFPCETGCRGGSTPEGSADFRDVRQRSRRARTLVESSLANSVTFGIQEQTFPNTRPRVVRRCRSVRSRGSSSFPDRRPF